MFRHLLRSFDQTNDFGIRFAKRRQLDLDSFGKKKNEIVLSIERKMDYSRRPAFQLYCKSVQGLLAQKKVISKYLLDRPFARSLIARVGTACSKDSYIKLSFPPKVAGVVWARKDCRIFWGEPEPPT